MALRSLLSSGFRLGAALAALMGLGSPGAPAAEAGAARPGASTAPRAKLLPVPESAAQAQAEKLIKDLFKTEYSRQASPAAKRQLAATLLEEGTKTNDNSTARFVCWREARDLAAAAGAVDIGLSAIQETAELYAINPREMKAAFLATLAMATPPPPARPLAEAWLKLSEENLGIDDYAAAVKAATQAETSAKVAQDPAFLATVKERASETRRLQKEFQRVKLAYEKLKDEPADAESNLQVGKFLCFVKRDWDAGFRFLAKGEDRELVTVAFKELAARKGIDGDGKLDLGHRWWEAAEKEKGPSKASMQARSVHWYQQVLPTLSGLTRTLVEKRIQEARGEPAKTTPPGGQEGEELRPPLAADVQLTRSARLSATDQHYVVNQLAVAKEASGPVVITVAPGVEIRGGTIDLQGKGRLVIAGKQESPVVLRKVRIIQDLGGGFTAQYAVFDQCSFSKGGAWFASYSSKWQFDSCLLYRVKFPALTEVDYGFQFKNSSFASMVLPEIHHPRPKNGNYDVMNFLRHEWNKIELCNFIDCTVPPTIAWCSENSNYWLCKFIPGPAFESERETQVDAHVAEVLGDPPHKVFSAKPAVRAPIKVLYAKKPFATFRFSKPIPLPDLRDPSKLRRIFAPKK